LSIFLLFVFIFVTFFGFHIQTASAASWYNASWTYRTTITIDHTKVGLTTEDESNFPVLVSLTGLSNIKAAGADIRFTSSDGTTELPREIESYSSGTLVAHVKIPTLSHTSDTVIYMYYGNSSATEPAANSTYGSQNVWTNGYAGVWHMNETSGNISDSTSNGNTATVTGSPTYSQSGQIGSSITLGSGKYFRVNSAVVSGTPITFSAWFNSTDANTEQDFLWETGTSANYLGVGLYESKVYVQQLDQYIQGSIYGTNAWHYITGVLTSGSSRDIYYDGGNKTSQTTTVSAPTLTKTEIGTYQGFSYLRGSLDEVRISSVARSSGWISTEYKNQSATSTFYSTVAPTAPDAPTALTPTADDTEVSLSWTAPANNGGAVITDYVIDYKLSSDSSWSTFADGTSTSTTATVINLTNGSSYDFRVSAHNAVGTGSVSATATATPATVPSAPAKGTATKGNVSASVAFTPPNDGGSAITNYTVTSSPGSFTNTGVTSPIVISGLTNGTPYTFTITATNAMGTSPASVASDPVTPATVPGEPIAILATPGNTQVSLFWTQPVYNGDSAITDYI
ncbi:MAG: DUF2341 domain-containing protein, partial [Planctomycetota bacterium]